MKSLLQRRTDILTQLEKRGLKIQKGAIIPRWICTSGKRKEQTRFKYGMNGFMIPQHGVFHVFDIENSGSFIHIDTQRLVKGIAVFVGVHNTKHRMQFFYLPTEYQILTDVIKASSDIKHIEQWLTYGHTETVFNCEVAE